VDGSGNLYAGGNFTTAGGASVNNIARWDGATWSALGAGVSGWVQALTFDQSGNLYAAGAFVTAGGSSASRLARWNGSAWSSFGSGLGMQGYILALALDGSGNIYVGGPFNAAGNKQSAGFALWHADGTVSVPAPHRPLLATFGSPSPNPFRAATRLAYELPAESHVRAAVFDVNGRRVCTLMDEAAPAGAHALVWDGRDARGAQQPPGLYLIQAVVGRSVATRRVALIR
jgi:hypothetical protein